MPVTVLAGVLDSQLVQISGALLILFAFAGAQAGRLTPASPLYLWLNLVGAAILGVLALDQRQWGFVLLEVVWVLVALWGLAQLARGRGTATPA